MPTSLISMPSISSSGVTLIPINSFRTYHAVVEAIIVKAPIANGEKVAELVVKKKDEVVKTIPLYSTEDLKKVNFFKSLFTSLNYLIWGDV